MTSSDKSLSGCYCSGFAAQQWCHYFAKLSRDETNSPEDISASLDAKVCFWFLGCFLSTIATADLYRYSWCLIFFVAQPTFVVVPLVDLARRLVMLFCFAILFSDETKSPESNERFRVEVFARSKIHMLLISITVPAVNLYDNFFLVGRITVLVFIVVS